MAGLAAHALVAGGTLAAVGAFSTAAAMILILMFGFALAVTALHERSFQMLRVISRYSRMFAGTILVLVGIWFLALAIWADFFATVFPV